MQNLQNRQSLKGKELPNVRAKLLFFMLAGLYSGASIATPAEDIPGNYYLRAMEVDSRIILQPDHTFTANIAYAGAQGEAQGHWDLSDKVLTLTSDEVEPPADKLLFSLSRARNLKELQAREQTDAAQTLKQAQSNYLLNLKYARSRPVPTIPPVTLVFEFNHGPAVEWLWDNAQGQQYYLPYSEERSLTRVGFQSADNAQVTQWFPIDPATRAMTLNWTVDRANSQMIYQQPDQLDLGQSQHYLRNAPSALALIDKNYRVSMYYDMPADPPAIKPMDIFWSFDDGSSEQQQWTDSRQQQLRMPVSSTKTLKKFGVKLSGTAQETEWFDVAPDSRAFYLLWEERIRPGRGNDLSAMFKSLELQVDDGCLAVDLGRGVACYRK
ncbi:hypothetical protein [Pseudomonas sp. LB3P31]